MIHNHPLNHPHYLAGGRRPLPELPRDQYVCQRCGVIKDTRGDRKDRPERQLCRDCIETELLVECMVEHKNDPSGKCPVCRIYIGRRSPKSHWNGEVWVCDPDLEEAS